jgi:uncharacterized protein (TIGR02611 family)
VGQEQSGARRPPLIERIRERQERHRRRSLFIRVPFALAGSFVLLLGVIMLFTPGPGWAVIIFGLGLLALEFTWAERLLERVINQVERASDQMKRRHPVWRAVILAVGAAVAAASVVALLVWDIPLLPG